ncbi:hypothetical protein HD806DRAFT_549919 [Xylariaceae sp. AK1471]|nr:hypothetical protein HD806DRAFT_549919 [Xylariaceae sp. AK1471]
MRESIASHVTYCLILFRSGFDSPEVVHVSPPGSLLLRKVRDEHTRFKVWSGNIGAHRTGTSSLDYRLRDSSHIRTQIILLLQDLRSLLEDAIAILSGNKSPWDQLSADGESDTEIDARIEDDSPDTELEQISIDVADVIDCLLRMSITFRNPSRHDRFVGSESTETLYFEPFDIQHVRSKFASISVELAKRLGRSITRRRQYFKYRETHHAKLSRGLVDDDELDAAAETIASSIPEHSKEKRSADQPTLINTDNRSDTGISETSYATTMANDGQRHIPPLPEEAYRGPFECPFCFMIIIATNRLSWKKHVYEDLRPYICLAKDCKTPEREFSRRHDWIQHVKQNHWKIYKCPFVCDTTFTSASDCKSHVAQSHSGALPPTQVDALIELGTQPLNMQSGLLCPLCCEAMNSIKEYQRHVGRHQVQLALFALPNISSNDDSHDELEEEASDERENSDRDEREREWEAAQKEYETNRAQKELEELKLVAKIDRGEKRRERTAHEERELREAKKELDAIRERKERDELERRFKQKLELDRLKEEEAALKQKLELDRLKEEEEAALAEKRRREKEAKEAVEKYKKEEAERALKEKEETEERELREAKKELDAISERKERDELERRLKQKLELDRLKEEEAALAEKRRREKEAKEAVEKYQKEEAERALEEKEETEERELREAKKELDAIRERKERDELKKEINAILAGKKEEKGKRPITE